MADKIVVSTDWLLNCSARLDAVGSSISKSAAILSQAETDEDSGGRYRISWSGTICGQGFSGGNVASIVSALGSAIRLVSSETGKLSAAVNSVTGLFDDAEMTILGLISQIGEDNGGSQSINSDISRVLTPCQAGSQVTMGELNLVHPLLTDYKGAWQSGEHVVWDRNILGVDTSLTFKGDLGGYSTSGTGKFEINTNKGNAAISIGRKGEAHLAKGEGTFQFGDHKTNVAVTVGSAAIAGSAGLSLYKDGKLSPSLDAKIKAEVAALKAEYSSQKGSDEYNVHTKGDFTLGAAEGEASVGLGKITYEDKNGIKHQEVGVQGKLSGGFYAYGYKVQKGITIMGIEINVGTAAKVGGLGGTLEGHVTSSGFGGKVGLTPGVGGDIEVSVDYSKFKPPEFISNLFKKT